MQVTEGGLPLHSHFSDQHFQDSYLNGKVTESWSKPTSDLKHIPYIEWGEKGSLGIRPNAEHPLHWEIRTTPVSPTQRCSPDLLWYLLILAAPSEASLGPQGLGGLQKLIPVFSSACPLWQLQWVSKWSKQVARIEHCYGSGCQPDTDFRDTKVTLGRHAEVVEDTDKTDSLDSSTSGMHHLSLGLGTLRQGLTFKCVSTSGCSRASWDCFWADRLVSTATNCPGLQHYVSAQAFYIMLSDHIPPLNWHSYGISLSINPQDLTCCWGHASELQHRAKDTLFKQSGRE